MWTEGTSVDGGQALPHSPSELHLAWPCWSAAPSPEPGPLGYPRNHAAQEQEAQGRVTIPAALLLPCHYVLTHQPLGGGAEGGVSQLVLLLLEGSCFLTLNCFCI